MVCVFLSLIMSPVLGDLLKTERTVRIATAAMVIIVECGVTVLPVPKVSLFWPNFA